MAKKNEKKSNEKKMNGKSGSDRKSEKDSSRQRISRVARKTKQPDKLTLYDILSHLTWRQASELLGESGSKMLRHSMDLPEINLDHEIFLSDDLCRINVYNDQNQAVPVSIILAPHGKKRLIVKCPQCGSANSLTSDCCVHAAAVLSFILEEKSLIGLAECPDLETPFELLSDKQLANRALFERQERAKAEKFKVLKSLNPDSPWTDYLLQSEGSGKTYRIALRGEAQGSSYCSCPDFKTNRLGTCKHILYLLNRANKKFNKETMLRPYLNKDFFVAVRYNEKRTLFMGIPDNLHRSSKEEDKAIVKLTAPFVKKEVDNVKALLRAVSKLERMGRPVTIYPDAEEMIQAELARQRVQQIVSEIRANPQSHPLRKSLLKVPLLPYQLDGIAFAVGAGRAVLADDMGLGKTIQGIGTAELLAQLDSIKKVLIVCPATVKSQWKNEIKRFTKNRSVQLILGSSAERFELYNGSAFFTICNYEQVLRDLSCIENTTWDLIILDEGQRIKNWESKTSRAVKALRSKYALVLTGTPLENRLDDLYSIVQFIDDHRLLPAWHFFQHHRIVSDTGRVQGYKNLDEIREQLAPIMLRRTRDSVRLELPERSTEIIRVSPTEEQKRLHDSYMQSVFQIAHKKFLTEMDLIRLQKLLLAARMSADSTFLNTKEEPSFSSKLDSLSELLEQMFEEKDRKIVLFSEWTTMLNLITPILEKNGRKYVRLDGSVPQHLRERLVREFQDDPDCSLFITTNAGSVGLNLQAANTVVNVDLPWNPAVLEQRIGRAHRMGQKNPVQVYLLITEETIEENMLATLSAKHDLALATLDVGSSVSEVELQSGIEELRRRLELLLGSHAAAPVDVSGQQREEENLTQADQPAPESNAESNTDSNDSNSAVSLISNLFDEQKNEVLRQTGTILLNAAFDFFGELIDKAAPHTSQTKLSGEGSDRSKALTTGDRIKSVLSNALSTDESGRTRLSLVLPEKPVLENLVQSALGFLNGFLQKKDQE
ncbi:MAG: DEAD/DEAH box helicase [Planctomycetia bacterium]|nr:DEAD/DEAH box helicase [Planctomycetia bacterium]